MTYNPNRALLKLTGTLLMLILLGVYAIWITHTDIDMDFRRGGRHRLSRTGSALTAGA